MSDITLEQAQKIVEAARKKAEEIGTKMNIAVVDAGANLKAFARMDGAWLGSIDISVKKAPPIKEVPIPEDDLSRLIPKQGEVILLKDIFFEWDQATYDAFFHKVKGAVEITIPKLNEMACEQVELAAVPFVSFIANKGQGGESAAYSFVLRGYVRHWLGNVWGEYDRIKLADILGEAEHRAAAM